MWDIFCLLYLLVRKQIRGKMNHEWWWLVDMMSAQVCFPFKGLALQLFWESIRCPSECGHLASNRCAIASREQINAWISKVTLANPKEVASVIN